jgi:hypothetical protein
VTRSCGTYVARSRLQRSAATSQCTWPWPWMPFGGRSRELGRVGSGRARPSAFLRQVNLGVIEAAMRGRFLMVFCCYGQPTTRFTRGFAGGLYQLHRVFYTTSRMVPCIPLPQDCKGLVGRLASPPNDIFMTTGEGGHAIYGCKLAELAARTGELGCPLVLDIATRMSPRGPLRQHGKSLVSLQASTPHD